MKDVSEMSKSMKIKSVSKVFFLKEFESTVKILPKDKLIKMTKGKELGEQQWTDFLDFHEIGTRNRFPKQVNLLRSAHLSISRYLCILPIFTIFSPINF